MAGAEVDKVYPVRLRKLRGRAFFVEENLPFGVIQAIKRCQYIGHKTVSIF